ncbi:MAG: VOC family protein [Thermoplasmata archaeon]
MQPNLTPRLAPYLAVKNAGGLVRFIEEAMGGIAGFQEKRPDGTLGHAEVRVADGLLMIADVPSERPLFPAMLHLYVPDADAAYARALKAGASKVQDPTIAPNGDKRGGVRDAWGNEWWFTSLREPGARSDPR